jgi:hypothetical protein
MMPFDNIWPHSGASNMQQAIPAQRAAVVTESTHPVPVRRWHATGHQISIFSSLTMAVVIGVFFLALRGWSPPEEWQDAGKKWVRKPAQSMGAFRDWQDGNVHRTLLYDYGLDRTVEISRLARWILGQLNTPASTEELVDRAASKSQEPVSTVGEAIRAAVEALSQKGLVRPA